MVLGPGAQDAPARRTTPRACRRRASSTTRSRAGGVMRRCDRSSAKETRFESSTSNDTPGRQRPPALVPAVDLLDLERPVRRHLEGARLLHRAAAPRCRAATRRTRGSPSTPAAAAPPGPSGRASRWPGRAATRGRPRGAPACPRPTVSATARSTSRGSTGWSNRASNVCAGTSWWSPSSGSSALDVGPRRRERSARTARRAPRRPATFVPAGTRHDELRRVREARLGGEDQRARPHPPPAPARRRAGAAYGDSRRRIALVAGQLHGAHRPVEDEGHLARVPRLAPRARRRRPRRRPRAATAAGAPPSSSVRPAGTLGARSPGRQAARRTRVERRTAETGGRRWLAGSWDARSVRSRHRNASRVLQLFRDVLAKHGSRRLDERAPE